MRDVSPLKAVVVHFGVNLLPSQSSNEEGVVRLRKFQAWTLENDGGTDTKFTWCGLVPIGGRVQKMSSWISSGSELKEKTKFVERLVNIFVADVRAREAIAETHAHIAYNVIKTALHREVRKLSISYLTNSSEDYKVLVNEIQPIHSGRNSVMKFDQDYPIELQARKRKMAEQKLAVSTATLGQRSGAGASDKSGDDDGSEVSSVVTVPLSPVPSHTGFAEALLVDEEQSDRAVITA
jgi:hypothetical protein